MCNGRVAMPTNLALDDKLVQEVKRLGGHTTKRAAVNEALQEYVTRRKQKKILEIFGTLEWDSTYDYKMARKRK
jgi:Arc/MetJ family transcription regulator